MASCIEATERQALTSLVGGGVDDDAHLQPAGLLGIDDQVERGVALLRAQPIGGEGVNALARATRAQGRAATRGATPMNSAARSLTNTRPSTAATLAGSCSVTDVVTPCSTWLGAATEMAGATGPLAPRAPRTLEPTSAVASTKLARRDLADIVQPF